jgi:hypothetical protein
MKKNQLDRSLYILILLFGITISLIQFFYSRSLWFDESALALNIIHLSFLDLLKPLDYGQVAPILFLEIEKMLSFSSNNTDNALRIFPLISYLISIYFFFRTLRIYDFSFLTSCLLLFVFVLNPYLIYYSNEIKQYASDLMVSSCYLYLVSSWNKGKKVNFLIYVIVGLISIYLSNITIILVASLGSYLLVDLSLEGKQNLKPKLYYMIYLFMVFISYYFLFISNHPSKQYMLEYWEKNGGFININFFSLDFYKTILGKFRSTYNSLFALYYPGELILAILNISGIIYLLKFKDWKVFTIVISPLLIHFGLSCIKLYPFDTRLIIYQMPFIILTCAFGFDYLLDYFKLKYYHINKPFLFIILALLFTINFIRIGFPLKHFELKKGVSAINNEILPSDKFFVSYWSRLSFKYYLDLNKFEKIKEFKSDNGNIKVYEEELNALLPGRYWMFFSHNSSDQTRQKIFLNYCKDNNVSLKYVFKDYGIDVYLLSKMK